MKWFLLSGKSFKTIALFSLLFLTWGEIKAQSTSESAEPAPSPSNTVPAPQVQPTRVVVIPIQGDIDASIIYIIRRGVKEALEQKADALVLHMDTYGGRVDKTEEITRILRKFEPQEKTYTFIDTKAISAGAYIASATRHIHMAPASVIGAAVPVMMAPGGQAQPVNTSYEEKIKSALRGLVRANAEIHGHNPEVFDAMIDSDQGLEVGGVKILEPGKVLTLTSQEAERKVGTSDRSLLSAGTVDNLDVLLKQIGGDNVEVIQIEPTGMEHVARFLVSISSLLIAAALLFGYIEFKTPGFGVFGGLAAVFAMLFFFGHYIAGLSGYEFLVLFLIGVTLIVIELVLFPGTLVAGLIGFVLVMIALLRAMVDVYPNDTTVLPPLPDLQSPMETLGLALVLALLGMWLMSRVLPRTPMYARLVLEGSNAVVTPTLTMPLTSGMRGVASTPLRPSGTADFGQGPVDVVSEGGFIPANTEVSIIEISGSRVVVTKL
ncbi:MAG: nodulation protein NfeD [Candidatus Methylacidiphilales bacterium]